MTFGESMISVSNGRCVQRPWWASDYGNKVIGLRGGILKQFKFDKWSNYDVDLCDLVAEDWYVIPEAPTIEEILIVSNEFQKMLLERNVIVAIGFVSELRQMLKKRYHEDKRKEI